MPGVKDVDQSIFVTKFASYLKKKQVIKVPDFCLYCKTSFGKELSPNDPDWFYTRMASIARRLYGRSNCGVQHFRHIYGTGKRNGTRPKHTVKGSGSIARKALQELERLNMVVVDPEQGGRIVTLAGRKEMDAVANKVLAIRK